MFFFFNLNHLKELRNAKGLTQKQIADFLQITERQYRRYEATDIDVSMTKAIQLANYFDVSLDYLVGRTDDPKLHTLNEK